MTAQSIRLCTGYLVFPPVALEIAFRAPLAKCVLVINVVLTGVHAPLLKIVSQAVLPVKGMIAGDRISLEQWWHPAATMTLFWLCAN